MGLLFANYRKFLLFWTVDGTNQPRNPFRGSGPAADEAQEVWGTIQNTTSVAVLERYIQQFPASFYSDIARTRLAELKQNKRPRRHRPS